MATTVTLNHDPAHGWLSALAPGRIDEGQPADAWFGVADHVGLLLEDDAVVGFKILEAGVYDPDDHPELWDAPRFDVPMLGLRDAAVNEVVVAARALFGGRRTVNRELFGRAIAAEDDRALELWLRCLQAGDGMAHYALGYTLFGLGRLHEAYRHLRHYTEISPENAWAWWWLGRAAAALDRDGEAEAALRRAIELDPDDETGATEALQALLDGERERPAARPAATRPERVARFASALELEAIWRTSELADVLVVDAPGVPALIAITDDGVVRLQAEVGHCASKYLEDVDVDGADQLSHDPESALVWLSYTLEEPVDTVDPLLVRLAALGIAIRARELRRLIEAAGGMIVPPRSYRDYRGEDDG